MLHVPGCGCMKPDDQPCVGQRHSPNPLYQQLLGMFADVSGLYDLEALQRQQSLQHSLYVSGLQNMAQNNLHGLGLAQQQQMGAMSLYGIYGATATRAITAAEMAVQQQAAMQQRDLAIKLAIANVNDAGLVESMEETDRLASKEGFYLEPWYLAFCQNESL